MNFLLVYAFLISSAGFIIDFADESFIWKGTLYFKAFLAVLPLVPLVVNLLVFLRSDRNKGKVVLVNLMKAICMDYFDSAISRLKKPIYCNESSFEETTNKGGKFVISSTWGYTCPVQSGDDPSEHTDIDLSFRSNPEHITESEQFIIRIVRSLDIGIKGTRLSDCDISNDDEFSSKARSSIEGKFGFGCLETSFFLWKNKEQVLEVTAYFKPREHEKASRLYFEAKFDKYSTYSNINQIFNTSAGSFLWEERFIIGNLNIDVSARNGDIQSRVMVKNHTKDPKETVVKSYSFDGYLSLIYCLKFWEENPNKGVMNSLGGCVSENPDFVNLFKKRGSSFIYHCFGVAELHKYIGMGGRFVIRTVPLAIYRPEGDCEGAKPSLLKGNDPLAVVEEFGKLGFKLSLLESSMVNATDFPVLRKIILRSPICSEHKSNIISRYLNGLNISMGVSLLKGSPEYKNWQTKRFCKQLLRFPVYNYKNIKNELNSLLQKQKEEGKLKKEKHVSKKGKEKTIEPEVGMAKKKFEKVSIIEPQKQLVFRSIIRDSLRPPMNYKEALVKGLEVTSGEGAALFENILTGRMLKSRNYKREISSVSKLSDEGKRNELAKRVKERHLSRSSVKSKGKHLYKCLIYKFEHLVSKKDYNNFDGFVSENIYSVLEDCGHQVDAIQAGSDDYCLSEQVVNLKRRNDLKNKKGVERKRELEMLKEKEVEMKKEKQAEEELKRKAEEDWKHEQMLREKSAFVEEEVFFRRKNESSVKSVIFADEKSFKSLKRYVASINEEELCFFKNSHSSIPVESMIVSFHGKASLEDLKRTKERREKKADNKKSSLADINFMSNYEDVKALRSELVSCLFKLKKLNQKKFDSLINPLGSYFVKMNGQFYSLEEKRTLSLKALLKQIKHDLHEL